jgi:transposase
MRLKCDDYERRGSMAKFKPYRKKQPMLLPPSLEDYVPASHLARVVDEVVEALDTKEIEDHYSHLGQNTYHPKIQLKLLFGSFVFNVEIVF